MGDLFVATSVRKERRNVSDVHKTIITPLLSPTTGAFGWNLHVLANTAHILEV